MKDETQFDALLSAVSECTVLTESGYSRLMQIMQGDVPTVGTLGIVTAENPQSTPITDPAANRARNRALAAQIRSDGYGYRQIIGNFTGVENPFFIMNIPRDVLLSYAADPQVDQSAVIFGERTSTGYHFELLTPKGKVLGVRDTVLVGPKGAYAGYVRDERVAGRRPKPRTEWERDQIHPSAEEYASYVRAALGVSREPESFVTWSAQQKERRIFWGREYSEYKGRKFKIPFIDVPDSGSGSEVSESTVGPQAPVSYPSAVLRRSYPAVESLIRSIYLSETTVAAKLGSERARCLERRAALRDKAALDIILQMQGDAQNDAAHWWRGFDR